MVANLLPWVTGNFQHAGIQQTAPITAFKPPFRWVHELRAAITAAIAASVSPPLENSAALSLLQRGYPREVCSPVIATERLSQRILQPCHCYRGAAQEKSAALSLLQRGCLRKFCSPVIATEGRPKRSLQPCHCYRGAALKRSLQSCHCYRGPGQGKSAALSLLQRAWPREVCSPVIATEWLPKRSLGFNGFSIGNPLLFAYPTPLLFQNRQIG